MGISLLKVFAGIFHFLLPVIIFFILFSCSDELIAPEIVSYNWQTGTPEELGLNASMLSTAVNQASEQGFINSLLVIRHGKIAVEKYFNGRNADSYQTIRSVSKSFLSALVGIAVSEGILQLDQKMIDLFPEYRSSVTDTNINDITLRHLITMRSGIKGDEEFYFTFTQSSNWVRTIISSQLNFQPGTKALYTTAGTHLVSAMLTKSSGISTKSFAEKYLFKKLEINVNDWSQDPQGIYFGGNDMFFTTRNMAVLGQLYLNNGNLNGEQIVSPEWINSSLQYSGGSSIVWGRLTEGGYGYMWWLGKVSGKKVFFALGHGGQFVLCVPDYALIVAVNSDPYVDWDTADEHERKVLEIIADYIIPAVVR
jgi:CubicO group peptidase (beta-lactamase class C family)